MRSDKVQRFARYGLAGGLGIGLFSGFIVIGPYLHSWSASRLLSVVLVCGALGAFVGYMALAIIAGSLVRGGTGGSFVSDESDGFSQELNAIAHEHHGAPDHCHHVATDHGHDASHVSH